ncbi:hypothetical protein HG537_0G02200 [Torulaspora globosa]|uniref:histidine kinase n=1 Tax=Torulaspora globosa TaxID=48254 RepID=A0A7H9HZF3_9SACH|nr:hypothetical protein HG537_0G02200 [Torulaspora sp. CBS 2947]
MRLTSLIKEKFSPPFRISIRTQLTALVSIVALVSLIILAVTTGVYFTSTYKNLRSERLYIAAQLKSSQIDQSLNYLYFQCYWLSSRDTLQTALANYISGNKTDANWVDAASALQKFLTSSALFSVARVYDAGFHPVLNSTNNGTGDALPNDILNKLMPLSTDMALPSSLETDGILTDPVLNGSSYLMSMSLPIYANPSIILTEPRVYGYVTIIMSADSLKSFFDDRTGLEKSNVAIISAVYNDVSHKITAYRFVFAPYGLPPTILDNTFPIPNDTFLSASLRQGKAGSVQHGKFFYYKSSAIGYSPCTFALVNWVAIVSQSESVFSEPTTRLTKIIIGVVVGIGAFICIVTFPLAHWAVQPIVRLQKATEIITEGRGLRSSTPGSFCLSRKSSSVRRRYSGGSSFRSPSFGDEKDPLPPAGPAGNGVASEVSSNRDHGMAPSSLSSVNEVRSDRTKRLMTSSNLIEARVPVYRRFFSDEFSELTDTFNTMTDALDQHYALLEDRVRARTKQLEAAKIEAEAANEAKTVFIANISHELRTPLNGILGMTAISMEERDIGKIHNSLKLIFRSGELLLHILTELLTFSKNVLQRTKLEKRDFNITDVALQIKSIFGKVAKDQRVRLSITLWPNDIRKMILYGDSNRIIQIVMNLVSNALKFTPVDGRVDVRIRLLGEYDSERSEKANHKVVYVVPGSEIQENKPEIGCEQRLKPDPADKQEEEQSFSESEKTDMQETSEEVARQDSDEQKSFISMSTTSYDDAIFHSQFRKPTNSSDGEEGIALLQPKSWVIEIEVEDTGPGIDPSLHESVFQPFVQGDQALSRQYGGTGLGLSICRQLATMMNGTMKLESTLGIGSKFTFTLPLTQTREIVFEEENPFEDEFNPLSKKNRRVKFKFAKSIRSRKSKSSLSTVAPRTSDKGSEQLKSSDSEFSLGNLSLNRPFLQSTGTASSSRKIDTVPNLNKNCKILVAEDNHVNQEVIKRMLVLEGLDTIELACDGQDAFNKVKALQETGEHYSLIFMDVQMPKVDGLLATKMIREDLHYEYPIVALTAFADDSNIKVCLEAGMNGFLSKPIKRPRLRTIIEEYCLKDKNRDKDKDN